MTNWEKVKLGRLLTESRIESGSPDTSRRIRVKLNVGGVEKRPETNDKEGATKYFIRKKGQFIYGRQNLHKGAFGIVPEELDGFESSSDIPAFDVDSSCYPEWIYYFFKQGNFYLSLESLAKGVGSKRIHPEQLLQISIQLPPKETQKAIIEKILTFEKNYATVVEENASQLSLLTSLRQAILTEAVQGRLTAQWRRDNPNHEHAGELLKRIATEKARPMKEKKISKKKLLPPITAEEMPYEAPEGWLWCRLGEVIELISGQHIEASDYNNRQMGVPYLTGPSDFGDKHPVFTRWSSRPKVLAQKNDILITVKGSGVGKLNILHIDNVAIGRQLMAIRSNNIDRNYIYLFLDGNYSELQSQKIGVAIPGIGREDILYKKFPLPPLPEQHAIVQKVSSLLAYCDELAQQVQQSKADLDLLMQAVLGEVFGTEHHALRSKATQTQLSAKETLMPNGITQPIYEGNTLNMELLEILQQQPEGKITAVNLWKMSKYQKDIDAFYEALKREVEEKKTIKEADEKGWLELVAS